MPDNVGQLQQEYIDKLQHLEGKISGDAFVQTFSKNCDIMKTMCGMALVYENRMKGYTKEIRNILSELKQAGGFRLDANLIKGTCICHCHDEDSSEKTTAEIGVQTEAVQTTDYIPPQGSNLTVADMVTAAATEACPYGGDYVYNEQYHMYYSASSGYYWDPKTRLFYQATTGTYYKYDEATQSYAVVDPPGVVKDTKDKDRRRRSRSRSKDRRRRRSRSRSRDRDSRRDRRRDRRDSRDRPPRSDSRKRRRRSESPLKRDEGECSDSGRSRTSVEMILMSEDDGEPGASDTADNYPPCIRFVVKQSEKLPVNSVQILPFPGGILGSPLKSDLCIPDQGIGKRHMNIYYQSESKNYFLEQLDGTNPSKVNGRLLKKGEQHMMVHMDRYELGAGTLLEIHIHDRGDTCGNCEPGLLQRRAEEDNPSGNNVSLVDREAQRRKDLKDIKRRYGLDKDSYTEPKLDSNSGYMDRAGERRTKVGSDFPHERDAPAASIDRFFGQCICRPHTCLRFYSSVSHKLLLVKMFLEYWLSHPFVLVTAAISGIAIYYYNYHVAKRPEVVCKNAKFRNHLFKEMSMLSKKFYPTPWCFSTYGQMIVANRIRENVPKRHYDRTLVDTGDGGVLALDIVPSDLPEDTPIAFLLAGLTGSSQTEYVLSMIPSAIKAGYRVAVMNNRGKGGVKLRTTRTYCGVSYPDMECVFRRLKTMYPDAPIVATGVSLGGIILGQYLSRTKENALVDAAMLFSAVYDIKKSTESIERPGMNLRINKHLTNSLIRSVNEHSYMLKDSLEFYDEIQNCQTIREFDDKCTSQIFGYRDAQHYYSEANLSDKLHHIKVPTIVFSAADDIFQLKEDLPFDAPENNDNIAMIVTQHGGHIGFMDGFVPKLPFYSERLYYQYLLAMRSAISSGLFKKSS